MSDHDADRALRQSIATAIEGALDDRLGPDSIAEIVLGDIRPELDKLRRRLAFSTGPEDCGACSETSHECAYHQGYRAGFNMLAVAVGACADDPEFADDVNELASDREETA